MKTRIKFILGLTFLLFLGLAIAQEKIGFWTVTKTVADPAVPERIVATNLWCSKFTVYGKKAVRTANVGTIYLGLAAGNDTQFLQIDSGDEVSFTARGGNAVMNLKDWYIDVVNAGDGVLVLYQ